MSEMHLLPGKKSVPLLSALFFSFEVFIFQMRWYSSEQFEESGSLIGNIKFFRNKLLYENIDKENCDKSRGLIKCTPLNIGM